MIIAHRGYKKDCEENTIKAFEQAFLFGAHGVETDISFTSDKIPVVSHDDLIRLNGEKIRISKTKFLELEDKSKSENKKFLTLDGLFKYISSNKKSFFLELKTSDPALVEILSQKIKSIGAQDRVHLIGFSLNIKSALLAQKFDTNLKVAQILMFPFISYIKEITKSHSIYIGWLDGVRWSEKVFRALIPEKRLKSLKNHFERKNFNIYGGVLNREEGIKYFLNAGIYDIFTDEVEVAVKTINNFEK